MTVENLNRRGSHFLQPRAPLPVESTEWWPRPLWGPVRSASAPACVGDDRRRLHALETNRDQVAPLLCCRDPSTSHHPFDLSDEPPACRFAAGRRDEPDDRPISSRSEPYRLAPQIDAADDGQLVRPLQVWIVGSASRVAAPVREAQVLQHRRPAASPRANMVDSA